MVPEQQQRILGYFIEEAKDHLNTIEQGLLNLQATIGNPEMANEVFRAAHSVKGGAAMLGIESMQRTAHRMEDYFKLLKEAPVQVDRPLESMFLQVFDALQDLLEQLQGPFGLTEEKEQSIMTGVEPVFQQLQERLEKLVAEAGTAEPQKEAAPVTSPVSSPRLVEESALKLVFSSDVSAALREMLARFKQADTDDTRSALEGCCRLFERFGEQFNLPAWMNLVKHARWAVCDRNNDYRTLAPVLIKEIKKAQDLVLAGREPEVIISEKLQTLAAQGDVPDAAADALDSLFAEHELDSTPDTADGLSELEPDLSLESALDEIPSVTDDSISIDDLLNDAAISPSGPEVGAAELTSLADLFEAGGGALDSDWQEEEIPINEGSPQAESLDLGVAPDFEDLLTEDVSSSKTNSNDFESGDELADLFDDTDSSETADERLNNLDSGLGGLSGEIELLSDVETTTPEESFGESMEGLFDDIATADDPSNFDDLFGDSGDQGNSNESSLDSSDAAAGLDDLFSDSEAEGGASTESLSDSLDSSDLFDNLETDDTASDESLSATLDSSDLFDNVETDDIASDESLSAALNDDNFDALTSLESVNSEELTDIDFSLDTADSNNLLDDALNTAADSQATDSFFSEETSSEASGSSSSTVQSSDFDDFFTVNNASQEAPSDSLNDDLWATDSAATVANTEPVSISDDLTEDIWGNPEQPLHNISTDSASLDEQSEIKLADDISTLTQEVTTDGLGELELDDVWASVEDADLDDGTFSEVEAALDASATNVELDDLFGDISESETSEPEQNESSESPAVVSADMNLDGVFGDDLEGVTPDLEEVAISAAPSDDMELGDLFSDNLENVGSEQTDVDSFNAEATELDDLFIDTPEQSPVSDNSELDNLFADDLADVSTNAEAELPDLGGLEDLESIELAGSAEADLELESAADTADNELDSLFADDLAEVPIDPEAELLDLGELESLEPAESVGVSEASLDLESIADTADSMAGLEMVDELPVSTVDFDLLDNDGIVTGFVTNSDGLESAGASVSLDNIDDFLGDSDSNLTESQDQDLEALDSLLSELPEEPASEHTALDDSDNNADELENLIESSNEPVNQETEATSTSDLDDEFGDLEALLQDTDKSLSTAAASSSPVYRQTSNRLSGRRTVANQTMRVSVGHLDNLSNLVGELVVNRNTLEQDQERLRQFLDNLLFQVQQLNDVGQRMRDLYERSLLESSLISSRQSYHMASTGIPVERTDAEGHATGESFDALEMDRFTGFHTLSQEMIELIVRVRESASDIAYTVESSDQVTRQFRQVTNQLQEGLNKARMVPFAQTASRLPRAVRDISLKCGKEARLVVEGRDILIDKMILEQLYDPMTHLVNNAITHGVETPEERRRAGKSSEGLITVRAFYQGNQTVISVGDDGAGITPDIVKQKALQKGLISEAEARTMTVLDVYDLLFHPGFSTRDQADDFAGRGFGMDVVRTSLADIRGNITIDSEPGRGTNFTIRLPLTLSISKALSCISNQARIAFPMDGVEDMFDVSRERIQKNDQGQDCILWRDTLLPFQNLSDLLSFNRTLGRGRVYGGNQDENMISIVVLRSANSFIALEVDQVMGEQEIVIKQLEGPVPKPTGIAGATVLGDGRVMPIADVLELIDLAMGRVRREPNAAIWAQAEDVPPEATARVKSEPTVLIVDDSITVRELLSMSFNKVGYRVEQARDGQEAWEKLRSGLPCDLVFCDIEMPRMDGLELLSRLQKDSGLQQIPIAMLTSRGADRHRQMAVDLGASGYFTKPYLEEALLDAANKMLHGEKLV